MRRIATFSLLFSLACMANFHCSTVLGDLVYNGNFDTPGANGPDTIHEGQSPTLSPDGVSAADGWSVWHNTNGSTETNWLTYDEAGIDSIDPMQDRATDRLMRVEASHSGNGLVQTFSPLGTGPTSANGSVWIYVTGTGDRAGIGIGNGGMTGISAISSGIAGQWEQLTFSESNSPVNEVTLYAMTSGVEFYVDRVSVSAVPEPAVAIPLLITGIGVLIRRRRRVV